MKHKVIQLEKHKCTSLWIGTTELCLLTLMIHEDDKQKIYSQIWTNSVRSSRKENMISAKLKLSMKVE